jgi:hypothetical protein
MSNNFAPDIVRDGLVMLLDAANIKSYNPAENLLQYSQAQATSPWTKIGASVTLTNNSLAAPDGTLTATLFNDTSFVSGNSVYQDITVSGTGTYTISIYAKAGTATSINLAGFFLSNTIQGFGLTVNLSTGAITGGTGYSVSVGNGWYRIYATGIGINALNTNLRFQPYAQATGTFYLWGAQINVGSYVRTYTPTTSAAITASTTWTDLSDTGNNVTLANAPSFTGTTFLFNGTNQWCFNATPNLPTNKLNSTCLCWCLPDSTRPADTYVGLVSYGGRSSSDARLMSYWTNTTTAYTSSAYWGNDYVPQATAITLNSWNMVGMLAYGAPTTNNTTLLAGSSPVISYVTGNSSNYTAGLVTTSINLAVASTDYPGRYFKGQIAVVMFYNRALTTVEIQQNYAAYRGRFGI